jgi:DNA-binding NtrC family response regulator
MKIPILIVDDDPAIRDSMKEAMEIAAITLIWLLQRRSPRSAQ